MFQTFAAYSQNVAQFALYPSIGRNVVYPILGLLEECGEVALALAQEFGHVERDAMFELGDVCWYMAATARELKYDGRLFQTIPAFPEAAHIDTKAASTELLMSAAALAGVMKKAMRDGPTMYDKEAAPSGEFRQRLIEQLALVEKHIERLAAGLGYSLPEIWEHNYQKLQARKEKGTIKGSGSYR